MKPSVPAAPSVHPRADVRPHGALPWWKTEWFFIVGTVAITLGMAWGMALHDRVSRAHNAYLQGEKYYGWYRNPAEKKACLDGELSSQRITAEDYGLMMKDSDLKNAYVWYASVLEFFPAQGDVWVAKSAERMKEVEPEYAAWLKRAPH
jgi:hypothetical protein